VELNSSKGTLEYRFNSKLTNHIDYLVKLPFPSFTCDREISSSISFSGIENTIKTIA